MLIRCGTTNVDQQLETSTRIAVSIAKNNIGLDRECTYVSAQSGISRISRNSTGLRMNVRTLDQPFLPVESRATGTSPMDTECGGG